MKRYELVATLAAQLAAGDLAYSGGSAHERVLSIEGLRYGYADRTQYLEAASLFIAQAEMMDVSKDEGFGSKLDDLMDTVASVEMHAGRIEEARDRDDFFEAKQDLTLAIKKLRELTKVLGREEE